METTEPMKFSDSTELSPEILKAVAKMGFQEMTPVQQQTLPLMMEVITFLKVGQFRNEYEISHGCEEFPDVAFLGGKTLNALIDAERRGTEYALYRAGRMSQTITLPEVNPYTIGQLLFFFEMATAYAGELLDVDAFNQPGVEGSKIASYAVLGNTAEKYAKKAEEMKSRPASRKEYVL